MATVVREIERKYDAGAAGVAVLNAVANMTGVAGVTVVYQQDEQTFDAVYFDTADLRLIRAGITLRRRTGGEDAGWHLKLPVGAGARDEIRLPLAARTPARAGSAGNKPTVTPHGSADGAVPRQLAALVGARTRRAVLAPVMRIRTSRSVLRLADDADRVLAEVGADHVWAEPMDGSASLSWDEIEAELVTGGSELLKAIDTRLRAAGARPAASSTKLQRALGGRLPPVAASAGPAPTAGSPAGEVLLAYLRRQVATIWRYDLLVRRDEADAVHQLRVAIRRARSALQAFGRIVEREATRRLREELKWLAATLGQARDAEVLLARFADELADIPPALVDAPVAARITGHLTAELARAGKEALRALDGQRYLRLLDDLDMLLADPPLTPLAERKAATVLAKPVRRAARRLQCALAAVPAAQDQDLAIHEARKAAKRARYAAEAALPALGSKGARQAAQAKKLQQLLGDHHDSVVARTVLRDLAAQARAAGEDTFTYGLMHERQACQAAQIERDLPHFTARAKK